MPESTHAFFDPPTVTMQREVVEDAWSRLAAGQRIVSRSLLAERILKAAKGGERNPAKLRAHAIVGGLEAGLA